MKKELFTLLIFFVISFSHVNSQVWYNPFFEVDMPTTWRKMTPLQDIETPVRQLDSIKIYRDIRLTPMVDGGALTVDIFEHRNGHKLNYKDFLDFFNSGKVINSRFMEVNNLKYYERELINEVEDEGEILQYYNTVWYIEGEKRVYRFNWGSYNEQLYKEKLDFVKGLLESFSEK